MNVIQIDWPLMEQGTMGITSPFAKHFLSPISKSNHDLKQDSGIMEAPCCTGGEIDITEAECIEA